MLIAVLCFVTAASRDGVAGGMQIGYCICIYIYIYIYSWSSDRCCWVAITAVSVYGHWVSTGRLHCQCMTHAVLPSAVICAAT